MSKYIEKTAVLKAIHDEIYKGGNYSGGWYEATEEAAEKNFTERINELDCIEIPEGPEPVKAHKCDPNKNTECKKTGCFERGGPCELTLNPKYAKEENK